MDQAEERAIQQPGAVFRDLSATPAELRYLLAWLPPALLTLKIKYSIAGLIGVRVITRSLGREGGAGLGPLELLSLYSSDLWLSFLLVPACWVLVLRISPARLRPWLTASLNLLLFVLLFATWQCFLQTGRYYSLTTMLDSLWWTWHHPEFVGQYVPLSASLQLQIAGAAICLVSVWARIRERQDPERAAVKGRLLAAYALSVVLLALVPFLAANLPASPYHRGVLTAAAEAMAEQGGDALPLGRYADLDRPALIERYRSMTGAPEPERNEAFFGRARGYNVLLFILETAPARIVSTDDLRGLPNLKLLAARAFAAGNHYSTYPYTDRAWFSILTSLYPSSLLRPPMELPGMRFPGLMRSLAQAGYATKVYYTPFQKDEAMFGSLGVAEQHLQKRTAPAGDSDEERTAVKIADDRATIAAAVKDIRSWAREGRNFCIAVGPQIGHGPWPLLPGEKADSGLPERGRATISLQDRWLGELIAELRTHRLFERTLIVIVGDHGVRTRQEDPGFEGGMIDEYSFHVPLLVFAPGVVEHRQDIPWVTSHIDITPTLLDLLGTGTGRELEQGSPLWEERLRDRTTFFFANHYLGADGYYEKGRTFMKNHISSTIYSGAGLHFGMDDIVPPGSAEHERISERIMNMVALQEVLGRKAGEGTD